MEKYSEKRFEFILMLFVLIGYFIISFFSFPKERIFHQVLLSFFLAYSASITMDVGKFHEVIKIAKNRFIIPVMAFILFSSIIFGAFRMKGEYHVKRALFFRANQQWHQVIEEIDKGLTPFYV